MKKLKNNKRVVKILAIVCLVFMFQTMVNAQNEIRLKISESDIDDAISAVTNARGINWGNYNSSQFVVSHYFVNLNNATPDIMPNNMLGIYLDIYLAGEVSVSQLIFAIGAELTLDAYLEGEVQIVGDNTEGYKLILDPTTLTIPYSFLPPEINAIVQMICSPNFAPFITDMEINLGTNIFPETVAEYFKPGNPILETTDSEIILNMSVVSDNIEIKNKLANNHETCEYEAFYSAETLQDFLVESGSSVTLSAGETIRLLPGFHAYDGSHFNAQNAEPYSFAAFPVFPAKVRDKASKKVINKDYRIETSNGETMLVFDIKDEEVPEKQNQVSVYPVPTSGTLNVKFDNAFEDNSEIRIYDTRGALVYMNLDPVNLNTIDLIPFQKGLFIVMISNGSEVSTHRVIHQ